MPDLNLDIPTGATETPKATIPRAQRVLTERDAIDIWMARWLRVRLKELLARYQCDSRRLYEIWWGEKFPASRKKAADEFRARYPAQAERTAFGYRRIPRGPISGAQADLFD